MSVFAIICWLLWGMIVASTDPFAAGVLALVFFYLTLFCAVTSTACVVGVVLRRLVIRNGEATHQVKTALRQAILFAVLMVSALFLLSQDLFQWTNAVLVIGIVAVIEFISQSGSRTNRPDSSEVHVSDQY